MVNFKHIKVKQKLILVMAAVAIANVVKSSLGPVGLDKMLVDDVGVCLFLITKSKSSFMLPLPLS